MFVEQSTNAEWIKRGDYFLKNKLWLVAAKCYQRANDGKCFVNSLFSLTKIYQRNGVKQIMCKRKLKVKVWSFFCHSLVIIGRFTLCMGMGQQVFGIILSKKVFSFRSTNFEFLSNFLSWVTESLFLSMSRKERVSCTGTPPSHRSRTPAWSPPQDARGVLGVCYPLSAMWQP